MENSPTKKPKDYVISTGLQISVRKFVEKCSDLVSKLNGKEKCWWNWVIDKIFNDNQYKINKDQIIIKLIKNILDLQKLITLKVLV